MSSLSPRISGALSGHYRREDEIVVPNCRTELRERLAGSRRAS